MYFDESSGSLSAYEYYTSTASHFPFTNTCPIIDYNDNYATSSSCENMSIPAYPTPVNRNGPNPWLTFQRTPSSLDVQFQSLQVSQPPPCHVHLPQPRRATNLIPLLPSPVPPMQKNLQSSIIAHQKNNKPNHQKKRERPSHEFTCTTCNFSTSKKCNFEEHKARHSGEKVSCPHCNRVFGRTQDMQRHVLSVCPRHSSQPLHSECFAPLGCFDLHVTTCYNY